MSKNKACCCAEAVRNHLPLHRPTVRTHGPAHLWLSAARPGLVLHRAAGIVPTSRTIDIATPSHSISISSMLLHLGTRSIADTGVIMSSFHHITTHILARQVCSTLKASETLVRRTFAYPV
ncbi:uncharacterized protein PSANT_03524 [Moesziomyces antarcticus]|uniref:Uncharacterized protein n=1 Tax=Pseudozyma antarctica TaxID=84753 RepID=A0A5C3FN63_PSEA2|nr:uncharacterized protein PSANT_03524 [Moesziomyces antarcticus]